MAERIGQTRADLVRWEASGGGDAAALLEALAQRVAELVAAQAAPRLPAQAQVAVAVALDAFLEDVRAGHSPATALAYGVGLRRLLATLPAGIAVAELATDQVVDFIRALGRAQPRPAGETIVVYKTACRRFWVWLLREGYRPDLSLDQLAERLRPLRARRAQRLPRVPADQVIEAIVAVALARPLAPRQREECRRLRDIALIELLRTSGARAAEVVGLRRGDLLVGERAARVLGKRSKERIIYGSPAAWTALEAYPAQRDRAWVDPALDEQPVFCRHDHGALGRPLPMTTSCLRYAVAALAAEAGHARAHVTPHRFRAWFATRMVAATGDLAAAQDLLGHESPETTRLYARVSGTRLAALHAQVFGGSGG